MGAARLVYEMSRMVLGESSGKVVVIKVVMDESGVHEHSPVLTVAAYIGTPALWRDWTKRWNIAKRPIKVFHSVDCANLAGEFKGWTTERRDQLVIRLLDVLEATDLPGFVIGIHMDDFRKAMIGHDDLKTIFGTPYTAIFHWVVQAIINVADTMQNYDRIAFVHESNDYRHEALEAFDWIKRNGNPGGKRVVGLLYADKTDYVPLQAADILAYEGNKRMRDPSKPSRRPWLRLTANGGIRAACFDRLNMADLI